MLHQIYVSFIEKAQFRRATLSCDSSLLMKSLYSYLTDGLPFYISALFFRNPWRGWDVEFDCAYIVLSIFLFSLVHACICDMRFNFVNI